MAHGKQTITKAPICTEVNILTFHLLTNLRWVWTNSDQKQHENNYTKRTTSFFFFFFPISGWEIYWTWIHHWDCSAGDWSFLHLNPPYVAYGLIHKWPKFTSFLLATTVCSCWECESYIKFNLKTTCCNPEQKQQTPTSTWVCRKILVISVHQFKDTEE